MSSTLVTRRALPFVALAAAFVAVTPTTAAPKPQAIPQPQLITVELQHNQIKNLYVKPTQSSVEPGGFEITETSPAEIFALGFKAGDLILNINGNPVGERMSVSDGITFFDVVRNKKPLLLRVIIHPAPRKSTTLDEDRFDRLVDHLDPTNGAHTIPVRNAAGPSGVRITSTLLALYLRSEVGDLIRMIDNQPVRTDAEVNTALRGLRVGTTEITLDRLGNPITLTIVRKAPLDLTAVRKITPTKFEVTRAFAEMIRNETDLLARKASTTANIRNGKQHGYTVYDIKPDAPAAVLGFQDGDIVLDVDGNRIDSYTDVHQATEQLEHAVSLVVHIERKGKPATLTYVIR